MQTINAYGFALDFYKNTVGAGYDALITLTAQSATSTEKMLETIPSFPAEGKKLTSIYFGESQRGLAILRKHVENTLEFDWTAKDAPLKSLAAIEDFSKDVLKESAEIQKEMKPLINKALAQLPKEAKEIVESSNKVVNSGAECLQEGLAKSFKAVQVTLTDAAETGEKATK